MTYQPSNDRPMKIKINKDILKRHIKWCCPRLEVNLAQLLQNFFHAQLIGTTALYRSLFKICTNILQIMGAAARCLYISATDILATDISAAENAKG